MNKDKVLNSAWFQMADTDHQVAKHLYLEMYPKPYEVICYHCQQAVEKYLKGILVYLNNHAIQKTHDLSFLLQECEERLDISIDDKYYDICDMLTPFGIAVRYPHELHVDEIIAKRAVDSVGVMKKMIEETFFG